MCVEPFRKQLIEAGHLHSYLMRMTHDDDGLKLVNPDNPPPALNDAARDEIAALARRQYKANGLLMKAINFVGGQVEDGLKIMPQGARSQIDAAARVALRKSYEAAQSTRTGVGAQVIQTDRGHKVLATISGALGGLGGLPTALLELPVATTMIFRAVQGVAAAHGEDPNTAETRLQCLAVFGAGGPGTGDDGVDTAFISARLGLTGAAVNTLISRVAPKFAAVLSQKLASQAVPILGAAAGAGTNYAFTDYYVEVAHVHFGLRRLARIYGDEAVETAFHGALVACRLPVRRASSSK